MNLLARRWPILYRRLKSPENPGRQVGATIHDNFNYLKLQNGNSCLFRHSRKPVSVDEAADVD